MRHIGHQHPSGFDGLVIRLLDNISTAPFNFYAFVNVTVFQFRPVSFHPTSIDTTYRVPLAMLVPPQMWPLAKIQRSGSQLLLYGLPYSHNALGLQVGERYTLATSARPPNSILRENTPYCAGDYFILPVLHKCGVVHQVPVIFMCVIQDTRTRTWLVRFDTFSFVASLIVADCVVSCFVLN